MTRMDRIGGLLAAVLLFPGLSAAAMQGAAGGADTFAVWLPDAEGVRGIAPPALLETPPGWCIGDAAAVLVPDGGWPDGLRARLVAALHASGAAVLALSEAPGAAPRERALRRDLRDALGTLRRIEGAGLIVAIGFGEGGDAALAAAEEEDGDGHGYAAAVRLGPGAPRFRIGGAPEEEGWPLRAPLFCELLAGVYPGGGGEIAEACLTSLASLR